MTLLPAFRCKPTILTKTRLVGWLALRSRASVALMVALLLTALIGAVALATDISVWFLERQRLQIAADSAAYAAAMQLGNSTMTSGGSSSFTTLVNDEVKAAVGTRLVGTLGTPAISLGAGNSAVTLTLSSTADTFFASALHVGAPTITVKAKAGTVPPTSCVLALNPTAAQSLTAVNGGTISASTCGGMANSNNSAAIVNTGSTMTFKTLATVGSYTNSGTMTPTPTTGAASVADPYAALTMPAFGSCTYTNLQANASNHAYSFTSGTVFCGDNTQIGGNSSSASFAPGIYYFTGAAAFNDSSVTTATGVTFVVTNATASGNAPTFQWINNGAVTWTAPTSSNGGVAAGGIAGIAFWQTCPNPNGSGDGANVNGEVTFSEGSPVSFSGAFYMPCGTFLLEDGAEVKPVSGDSNSVIASEIYVTQGTLTVQQVTGGTTRSVAVLQ